MLGDISGLSVLDAFAGSGALSFEALSRGASSALLIEIDKTASNTIRENILALDLDEKASVIQGNIKGWSNNNTHRSFDLVLCDPPYDAVLEQVIHKISRHVADQGLLVVSWPTSEPTPKIPDMELVRHKTYGNATLFVYKK